MQLRILSHFFSSCVQACFLEKSLDRCKEFQERFIFIVLIYPVEVPAKNLEVLNMGFTLLLRFGGGGGCCSFANQFCKKVLWWKWWQASEDAYPTRIQKWNEVNIFVVSK